MRRSLLARRALTIAFATAAVALAGCPAPPQELVDSPPEVTADVAPDGEEVESLDVPPPDVELTEPTVPAADPVGEEVAPPAPIGDVDAPPAVALERPSDFLRPTLPNAALEDLKEPADPPEAVTDRSAEAEDPLVLPGGTPVGDLFEGLEEKPSDASND